MELEPTLKRQIRRNLLLLAGCVTIFYTAAVMMTAMTPVTFVHLTHRPELSGLPPAVFLLGGALAVFFAGRLMDRVGRVKVIFVGFLLGILGCLAVHVALRGAGAGLSVLGFALAGASAGTVLLGRMAGADMFIPARRGRGIALVLMGAVVGGVLGPVLFMPLAAAHSHDAEALARAWSLGAAVLAVGAVLVLAVRPDPKKIAELIAARAAAPGSAVPVAEKPAPLSEVLRRRGVATGLIAAVTAHALMVALMSLGGYIMSTHGHHQTSIFTAVGAHFVGMFGLVLISGEIADRLGHTRAILIGLLLILSSFATLPIVHSAWAFGVNMFVLGWGWNFAFVAATSQLAGAARPAERGRLIGLNDLSASVLGALLVTCGGYALSTLGVAALAMGGSLVAAVPLLVVGRTLFFQQAGGVEAKLSSAVAGRPHLPR